MSYIVAERCQFRKVKMKVNEWTFRLDQNKSCRCRERKRRVESRVRSLRAREEGQSHDLRLRALNSFNLATAKQKHLPSKTN